jgi:hypothetical protein
LTKKPKKVKTHDKHSLSSGPLPSKPAGAADPFGTYPVPRVSIAASGQHSLVAPDQISASNRGGNPLVSILKPPMPVTSGFPAGDSPFPGASKPTSIEVASPRGETLRVAVSGVPLGTGDVLAQPIPDPPSGGPSLTHVSGIGGGELLFTPLGSRASRPVSRGSPGTLAAHPFPAPPPPGFEQVVLLDFASLLCPLTWSSPPPGAPRREPGQKCLWRPQFLVCLRDTSPPSRLSLGTPTQLFPVGTRLAPRTGAYPTAFAGTPPIFRPSPGCFRTPG